MFDSKLKALLWKKFYWNIDVFKEIYSAGHCPLAMLEKSQGFVKSPFQIPEKSKRTVEKGEVFRVLLIDLFEDFDCWSQVLTIAKLHAY